MNVEGTQQAVAAKSVSRRVIVKSAAWSVPVLATVGVTPAFAASSPLVSSSLTASRSRTIISFTWTFTSQPGLTLTQASITSVTGLDITDIDISGWVVTFTGTIPNGNAVPSFTGTMTLSDGDSFTFNAVGRNVPSTATFTVNPVTP